MGHGREEPRGHVPDPVLRDRQPHERGRLSANTEGGPWKSLVKTFVVSGWVQASHWAVWA